MCVMDCYAIVGENKLAEPGSTEVSLRSALSSQAGSLWRRRVPHQESAVP
jgi:hypothetical protein